MARKIVITSGKGGVGKTTFCANLGVSLAMAKMRVCLLDLDTGLNNLDVAMGIEQRAVFDIVDVVVGRARVAQALVQDEEHHMLYTLPSSQSFSRHNVTSERLAFVINVLDESFDYILIDCPAGIDDGFYKSVMAANEAIVVSTPHIFSIRDVDKVVRIIRSTHITSISLAVNRVRKDLEDDGEILPATTVSELVKCELIGVVPDDDTILSGTTIAGQNTQVRSAFDLIAKNLINGERKIFEIAQNKKRGLFSWFKKDKGSIA